MLAFFSVENFVSAPQTSTPRTQLAQSLPVWARVVLPLLAAVFLFATGLAEITGPRVSAGHYALNDAVGGFVSGDEAQRNQLRPQADTALASTVRRSILRNAPTGDGPPAQPAIVLESAILPAGPHGAGHAGSCVDATPRGVVALAAQPRAPPSGPRFIRTAA